MLSSRYAMWLGWGPDFTFFYNDDYARTTLGPKHPWALGRPASEVWSEIWGDIGPRAESVVRSGQATWDEGLLVYLLEADGRTLTLAGATGVGRDTPISPAVALHDEAAPWPFARAAEAGKAVEVDGLPESLGPMPGGAWLEPSRRAVVLPMARPGQARMAGFVVAGVSPVRPLDDGYRGFLDLIDADSTRLAQVFANLGVGIPPEMLPRVFAMFTQVDRSLERSQGGLGIGLSLVKTLAEMHGGSVEARSGGHDQGSEFVVRLPIVVAAPGPEGPDPSGAGTAARPAPLRVLVVDDNVASARTLARFLKLLGLEARTANDGGEAVEVAEEYRPELILLDIGLPILNGYDVDRTIRARPWGKGVTIVALTGWGQAEDRRRSTEAGFDRHFVKPVDPGTLEALLAGVRPGRAREPDPSATPVP